MSSALHATAQLARLADQDLVPWRNGGGVTRTLLTWPTQAHWRVRVSVANIDQSGPFSSFPGVHRCITVLAGEAVNLVWPHARHTLSAVGEPLAFDGQDPPTAELTGGPTQDLNLMVQGGVGQMQTVHPGQIWPVPPRCFWQGLYAAQVGCWMGRDGQGQVRVVQQVPAQALVWFDGAVDVVSWSFDAPVGEGTGAAVGAQPPVAWAMSAAEVST